LVLSTCSDILVYDGVSLKSMPSSFEGEGKPLPNTVVEGDGSLDVEAVEKAAVWLRKKLGLTIIGFDIVVSVCRQSTYMSMSLSLPSNGGTKGSTCYLRSHGAAELPETDSSFTVVFRPELFFFFFAHILFKLQLRWRFWSLSLA